ncbi:MAG: hypothetical protein COZ76_09025 [Flavobacteriales bacterium CG_4_8_14_3_um_filter_35_10]|nr:hypothetical protein [Zetaproteobacteria bacterium]PIX06415.1 MAG: hypothetical protein COZ76_09025 [Flavobacteriales bacterium CG_4_8_14_3_um_filter_35_10]PJA05226.1 MAG: hypothetical protein COX71_07675 [Flavobacteriales bacterium CG_4_10_14_0_2_um_filter_35_18]
MESTSNMFESLFEKAETFGKTTYEISKLKALETTTVVASSLVARLSVVLMLSIFTLVFNIGVALYLGDLLGKSYYGFFIVAAFYLIAGIVLHYFLHKWIKKPLADLIISQALQ